ncbi:MAG: type II and III secretion system protein [Bdellovibrio sp.]|nr:type II and III secretion system protein [Bdellovibrio sp.]
MKNFILFSIFISSLSFANPNNLTLPLGTSQRLPLKGESSVWIQDREILKAEVQGTYLVIRGSREGKTLLKVGANSYSIQVLHPAKTDSLEDLQRELKNLVGLSSRVAEGDLLIQGRLYRMKDWARLAEVARAREFSYQMRAELSVSLQEEAQEYFQDLFANAKLPPQTIIFQPSPEIRVNTADLLFKKYQQLLKPFGISVLKDENSLDIAPTVKVQITVVEIKRTFSLKYGLDWSKSYSAQVIDANKTSPLDLPFDVHAMESSGQGKILASPNILCRSGKEAEFLAGGEFPIKIVGYRTQDLVWKRYGILLKVKPKADAAGRISLSIDTEITTLDQGMAVDNIPGLLTNRVSSHFDLTRPQTIALSGLLKSEDGESSSGLPFLSRLPILGALFSSKDFREHRSELVIFVRPTILPEGDNGESIGHLKGKERI